MRWSRLYPRAWSDRYGAEVDELLARSDRPWRDRAGVVAAATAQHVEGRLAITRSFSSTVRRLLVAGAVVCLVLGATAMVWSSRRLTDGISEIPTHWWSTLAVASPLAAAAMLGAIVVVGRPRPPRATPTSD